MSDFRSKWLRAMKILSSVNLYDLMVKRAFKSLNIKKFVSTLRLKKCLKIVTQMID